MASEKQIRHMSTMAPEENALSLSHRYNRQGNQEFVKQHLVIWTFKESNNTRSRLTALDNGSSFALTEDSPISIAAEYLSKYNWPEWYLRKLGCE